MTGADLTWPPATDYTKIRWIGGWVYGPSLKRPIWIRFHRDRFWRKRWRSMKGK